MDNSFIACVFKGRWISLFFYFLLLAGSSGVYLFPLYSTQLKKNCTYNQDKLNVLSIFKDLGGSVGVLSELIIKLFPEWSVLIVLTLVNVGCYLSIWFSLEGEEVPKFNFLVMEFLFFFLGWSKSVIKDLCIRHSFSLFVKVNKGLQLVTLSSFVQIGGAGLIYFITVFTEGSASFIILILASVPTCFIFISLLNFRQRKNIQQLQKEDEEIWYANFYYVSVFLGMVLLIGSLVVQYVGFKNRGIIGGTVILSLFLSLLLNSFRTEIVALKRMREKRSHAASVQDRKKNEEEVTKVEQKTTQRILEILKFVALAFATSVGVASTITSLDAMGQIAEALALDQTTLKNLIQLILLLSLVGRFGTRILYGYMDKKLDISPSLIGVNLGVLLCFTHLSIAYPFRTGKSLFISCILMGLCRGGQLQMASMTLDELFQNRSKGFYQVVKISIPAFTYVLKSLLVSKIYMKHASLDSVCLGTKCFRDSFVAISSCVFCATLLMWVLVVFIDSRLLKIKKDRVSERSSTS